MTPLTFLAIFEDYPITQRARSHRMPFNIRPLAADAKLTDQSLLDVLEQVMPYAEVQTIVATHRLARLRRRKLSAELGLLLVVAMNLWARHSLCQVLFKLLRGFRFIGPVAWAAPASKGAISQVRYHVGAQPVAALFHQVCTPMTTPQTPGAFAYGLRLMALDSTLEEVADTPANARVFGRYVGGRGPSAFPLVRGVYLMEVGSHGIVDAGFWPHAVSEHVGAGRLLRSVRADMLVLWDRGLHSFDLVHKVRQRHAHFLSRVSKTVQLKPVRALADGSYQAWLRPSEPARRRAGQRVAVRVIDYTLNDPNRPGFGQPHRLITSLLDEQHAPALQVIATYHERWEIESALDEMDTHQRLAGTPLRSKKPVGVIQELYGLLIAHYAIRKVMIDAAQQERMDPDRLSFIHAIQLICDAIPEFQMTAPHQHERLYQRLLADIRRYRLPPRDRRSNPRVVKRKMSKFPRKRRQHQQTPQPKKPFHEAIVILN